MERSKASGADWIECIQGPSAILGPEFLIMEGMNKYYFLLVGKFFLSLKENPYGVLHLLLQIDQLQMRVYVAKTFLEQGPLTGLLEI